MNDSINMFLMTIQRGSKNGNEARNCCSCSTGKQLSSVTARGSIVGAGSEGRKSV